MQDWCCQCQVASSVSRSPRQNTLPPHAQSEACATSKGGHRRIGQQVGCCGCLAGHNCTRNMKKHMETLQAFASICKPCQALSSCDQRWPTRSQGQEPCRTCNQQKLATRLGCGGWVTNWLLRLDMWDQPLTNRWPTVDQPLTNQTIQINACNLLRVFPIEYWISEVTILGRDQEHWNRCCSSWGDNVGHAEQWGRWFCSKTCDLVLHTLYTCMLIMLPSRKFLGRITRQNFPFWFLLAFPHKVNKELLPSTCHPAFQKLLRCGTSAIIDLISSSRDRRDYLFDDSDSFIQIEHIWKSHESFTTLYHYTVCRIACHTSRSLYVAHGTRLLDHCFVCKSTKDRTFLKGCTNRNWQELEVPAGRKLIGSWSPSGAHLEPIWLRIFEYLLFDFFKSSNTFQLCPRQPMAARGRGNTVPLRLEIVDAVRVQNGAAWMEYSKAWRGITIKSIKELLVATSCYSF